MAIMASFGPTEVEGGRRGRLGWRHRLGQAALLILIVLGPWPALDPEQSSDPAVRLTLADLRPGRRIDPGPIEVGVGEADLTPASPRPLAGFIGRIATPFAGIDSPCLARALTVRSAGRAATVVAADLLMIDARMARAIADRAGVPIEDLYFTASHTHSGPGGWGAHPLEMLVAGRYDRASFDALVAGIGAAVQDSRRRTEPAEVAFARVRPAGRQANRIRPTGPTFDDLSAVIFRPIAPPTGPSPAPIAIFATFGAHATVCHDDPPKLGADYPGGLVDELRRATGARMVLFGAGAVGDASPTRPRAKTPAQGAAKLGGMLAADLVPAIGRATFAREVVVQSERAEVALPVVQVPFLHPWLRLSPLATWWVADRRTHLQLLRLGPVALVGFPGDYAGDLARDLAGRAAEAHVVAVPTSFDGDYRGYLVSERTFRERPCYETRWMNFYGGRLGDDLNRVALRMIGRSAGVADPPLPDGSTFAPHDLEPALIAACLVLVGIACGRSRVVRRRYLAGGAAEVGLIGFVCLGLVMAPGWVEWSRFGVAWPVRLAGLAGLVGFSRSIRPGRLDRALAGVGLALGMAAADWLVILLTARWWLRARARPPDAAPGDR